MKRSTKKQNGRKPNTRKNKGRKTRKTMRGGEPEIEIQDEFVNKVGSNTLSGFLKLLPYMFGKLCKHKYDIGYDAYNTTKYHFGTYDNMIKSLVELTSGHNSRKIIFEGTILDSIIKFKNNGVKLPALLKVITSLKLSSSNLAYFFTKNPKEDILDKSVLDLTLINIKDILKQYIDIIDIKESLSHEDTDDTRTVEQLLKDVISPVIDAGAEEPIIEHIKNFTMKCDNLDNPNQQSGWYLSTIFIELITNVLNNLNLTKSKSFLKTIEEINKGQIFRCELIDYLFLNKDTRIKDIYDLYKRGREGIVLQSEMVKDDISNFTILDFFNKELNTNGILPPFILFLLSCRINPDINKNPSNIKKNSIYNMLTSSCDIKHSLTEGLRPAAQTAQANVSRVNSSDSSRRSSDRSRSSSDSSRSSSDSSRSSNSSNSSQRGGIKIFGLKLGEDKFYDASDKVDTACTAESTFTGRMVGKFTINPIYTKICKDISETKFTWNSFDSIDSLVDKTHLFQSATASLIISNIGYMLAPYSTFFPLDIKRYIEDYIFDKEGNKIKFTETMNRYETKLIEWYKGNSLYTEPLCPPISIMNDVIKP
jgi:hypothetical protein